MTIIASFTAASPASANYWTPHADITCSRHGNVALIRFGGAEDEYRTKFRTLPSRIDNGLSRREASTRTDCALPNGWRLRLRDGHELAMPYGMGGADPPAFFSLWINRRKVFSAKQWKPGYGELDYQSMTALVIRPNQLTWCQARDDGPQRCANVRFRYGKRYRIDQVEYPANGRKWKLGTLLWARVDASAAFCRRYITAMRMKMLDNEAFSYALYGHAKAPFAFDLQQRNVPNTDVLQADVDIAPGIRRRLLLLHGENHIFDGDVVFVLPKGIDTAKLASQIHNEKAEDNPNVPPLVEARGWTRLVGGRRDIYPQVSPRYVHFYPERIDGRL
ncbi:MAG: hypothetical protein ABI240_17170, partial [Sphingomonas sp.]